MFSSNTSQVSNDAVFVEDVFSTWLYPGNSSTQTITNGIDLAGKGGLVWLKVRDSNYGHRLTDSSSSFDGYLESNSTIARASPWGGTPPVFQATSSGFNLNGNFNQINVNTVNYVSWTFRKQPKFFDVVTYTGNGGAQTISHSLGSAPGCIIIKKLDSTTFNAGWAVYHRSLTNPSNYYLRLDTTAAETNYGGSFISNVGSTSFDVNGASGFIGLNGSQYVAYLFAHNAGGFGLTGTDNVISCGSFTTDGSGNATVNLGYEPQWALIKPSNSTGDWVLVDTMRSWVVAGNNDALLYANTSDAEVTGNNFGNPTATGFTVGGLTFSNTSYIYIAIRRGPMKTPTTGTSVFNPSTWVGGSGKTTGFPLDSLWVNYLPGGYSGNTEVYARLIKASSTTTQSNGGFLSTSSTAAEDTTNSGTLNWSNTGYGQPQGLSNIYYAFRRAPGFFDVVCYTAGTSTNRRVDHNLTTPPQLILLKARNVSQSWYAYSETLGINGILYPNQNWAPGTVTNAWGSSAPTATNFGINEPTFASAGDTYVSYLFASCPGVSKVGSYTGTGTTKQIDCGFTGGARFVLIKRTDSTGDWYVWDSARGIVSGNDPYLLLNSTAAEVTNTDYVDTYSAGFEISSTAPAAINANGGSFIFLAIA